MPYWTFLLVPLLTGVTFWYFRHVHPALIKLKAQAYLQKTIFPEGDHQKREIMRMFHGFTNNRFNDDQILDYFIKIKGLQSMSIEANTSYWVKKYLLSPTLIKLNYFEQVKFYEIFLNFPGSMETFRKPSERSTTSLIHISNNSECSLSSLDDDQNHPPANCHLKKKNVTRVANN